jgi:hypothetical protein
MFWQNFLDPAAKQKNRARLLKNTELPPAAERHDNSVTFWQTLANCGI